MDDSKNEDLFLLSTIKLATNLSIYMDGYDSQNIPMKNPEILKALRVLDMLHTFYMPFLIVLGLLGNSLSFTAFYFTQLNQRSSSHYLGCLAISDFGYISMLIFFWLAKMGYDVTNINGFCPIIVYLSSSFCCWSVWLTVAFTAERYLAVNYVFQRLHQGTKERAKAVVGGTAILSFSFNIYILFVVGVNEKENEDAKCDIKDGDINYQVMYYLNIIDTILTLIIPVFSIIFMNTRIGITLYQFYSNRSKHSVRINFSKNDMGDYPRQSSSVNRHEENSKPLRRLTSFYGCQNQKKSYADNCEDQTQWPPAMQINISRMLLLVSSVFIVLNLPSYVIRILGFIWEFRGKKVLDETVYVLQGYFMLLFYTNFAINFVVYNVSSRMFRRVLFQKYSKCYKKCRERNVEQSI